MGGLKDKTDSISPWGDICFGPWRTALLLKNANKKQTDSNK